MGILIEIFCFSLVFNYIATTDFVEFTFDAVPLGHSGLLVFWKPNITTQSEEASIKHKYFFAFENYIIGEKNNDDYESSDNDNHGSGQKNDPDTGLNYNESYSSMGQYKIHSLKENTLYNITIKQYSDKSAETLLKEYSVERRTSLKSKRTPAEPYFEIMYKDLDYPAGVRWFPCGKERTCNDQESGTHFGVTVRKPFNTRKLSEVSKEEFYKDYIYILFWPGILYEIFVYSINDDCKTDSDSREIFVQPMFTSVQYVNIISLPDLSALISWKPPKQSVKHSVNKYVVYYCNLSTPNANGLDQIMFTEDLTDSVQKRLKYTEYKFEQIRIFNLEPEVIYTYTIVPQNEEGHGFQYQTVQKFQVHNKDLPIAKPDFNYKFEKTDNECQFYFQWLPCGQSSNCKNTKPGSNYTLNFKPEPLFKNHMQEYGYYFGYFNTDAMYTVTMKSSIGDNFSESVTKIFKNCDVHRENTPSGEKN